MDITPSHRARLSHQYGFEPDALEKTMHTLRCFLATTSCW